MSYCKSVILSNNRVGIHLRIVVLACLILIVGKSNLVFGQSNVKVVVVGDTGWSGFVRSTLPSSKVETHPVLPQTYVGIDAVLIWQGTPPPDAVLLDSLLSFVRSGGNLFINLLAFSGPWNKVLNSIGLTKLIQTAGDFSLTQIQGVDTEFTRGLNFSQGVLISMMGYFGVQGDLEPIMYASDAGSGEPFAFRSRLSGRNAVWETPGAVIGASDSEFLSRVICNYFNLCSASVEAPNILSSARIYQDLNSTVTVQFNLASSSDVSIELFDVLGNKLRTVLDRREDAGDQQLEFDLRRPTNLASGTYYCRLKTASGVKTAAVQME